MIDDLLSADLHCAYTKHGLYLPAPGPPQEDHAEDQKPFLNGTFMCMDKPRSNLPIDAPVQPRRYLTPSVTSRRDLPAHFAKQLNRCPVMNGAIRKSSEDEQDQLSEEAIIIDQDLVEQIEEKRRRNTMSARKSRQRKMQQMRDLEQERDDLLKLVHDYRKYVLGMQKFLQSQGLNYNLPTFCEQ